jgi:ribosomal-protein-alanine N-acetyltransferase
VRAGVADDLDAMVALDVICFDKRFRFSRAAMRRLSQGPNRLSVIAETGVATLAGFSVLSLHPRDHSAYLTTLDVAPEFRRLGLAGLLMETTEAYALTCMADAVKLHVFAQNAGALALYLGRGYVELGVEPDFYGAGLDAVVMQKELDSLQNEKKATADSLRG